MVRIVIDGLPGAGKTKLLHDLVVPAGYAKIEFVPDTGLFEKYRADPGEYALALALDVLLSYDAVPEDALVVGGPSSARHVYANYMHNTGWLTDPAFDLYKAYHARLGWTPDVVLYVEPPPDATSDEKLQFQYRTYVKYSGAVCVEPGRAAAQRAIDLVLKKK